MSLRGDFSFDALSRDGSLMYLIEHLAADDLTPYRVRVYDVRKRRLLPRPVVHPDEPPGDMRGLPITRAVSRHGRWAYTLYDGEEHPFIRALDTERRRAVCVDLHLRGVPRSGVDELGLAVARDGTALRVESAGRALARVDTRTFEVTEPGASPAAESDAPADEPGVPWVPLAAAVFGPGLLGALAAIAGPLSRAKT